jgi:hypothetical protein
VEYQLVPPHCHRRNAAERAIHTFNSHFVAGLASVDPYFPLHLWDRLLPQEEMTLNLLQTSIQHPQLSAAAHYHGLIDYNKTAFSLPGCKIIAHEKPVKRRTWAPMANMATLWAQQCITIDVRMFTFPPLRANAQWTLWSFFLTIHQCHNYHPHTY